MKSSLVLSALALAVVVLAPAPAEAQEAAATSAKAPPNKTAPKKTAPRTDVSVGAALARLDDGSAGTAALAASATPATDAAKVPSAPAGAAPPPTSGTAPQSQDGLARIYVGTQAASDRAGTARDVSLGEVSTKVKKPVASARHERKLGVAKAVADVRSAAETCRAPGSPSAQLVVRFEIAPRGSVEVAELRSSTPALPASEATCVQAALEAAKFGAPGGAGVELVVPVALSAVAGEKR